MIDSQIYPNVYKISNHGTKQEYHLTSTLNCCRKKLYISLLI